MKLHLLIGCAIVLMLTGCKDDDSYSGYTNSSGSIPTIYPLPPEQWMGAENPYYTEGYVGDVMPYYTDGMFRLFFLHDAKTKPSGEGFHDIHQLTTTDFTQYDYHGRMIPYGDTDEPDFAVGTGSVVQVGSLYYYYYTGHNGNSSFIQQNPRESVLCATSTDLEHWTKISDFKLTAPTGYYDYDFRDPHVFYNEQAGKYWMLVSTQTDPERKAVVLLFTCEDPATQQWEVSGPLYTTTPEENYLMLECADIFQMGSYWYLLFSENWSATPATRYRIANSPYGPWATPEQDRLDGGYFYAAKSVSDGLNRYLIGWSARRAPETNVGTKEWAGNMVPHQLHQNSDGTLALQQPLGIESLFTTSSSLTVTQTNGNVTSNSNGVTMEASNGTAECFFSKISSTNFLKMNIAWEGNTKTGLWLSYNIEDSSGLLLALEPENDRMAAYWVTDTSQTLVNWIDAPLEAGTHQLTLTTNKDVVVCYLDDKIAFTNRLYEINNNTWGIWAENGDAQFTNLELLKTN